MFARSSYAGAEREIMGNINRTEVEELARALADQVEHPARNLKSDPRGSATPKSEQSPQSDGGPLSERRGADAS